MKLSQRAAAVGTLATSLVCAAAVVAPQAGAATTAAKYNGACGSGHKVVNSAPIGSAGTVFLTYNATEGVNCVVTVRTKPGAKVYMEAAISSGTDPDPLVDFGDFTTYAGPVHTYARGMCVTWYGQIDGHGAGGTDTNCGKAAAQR